MPLVVVCGKPSSGKSTFTECFCKFVLSKRAQLIEVISDSRNASFTRSIYKDFHKEREHRAVLKSEVQRFLSEDCLVICDSLNYIKGFRYELFCIAKLMQTTYCVVYCDTSEEVCHRLNLEKDKAERYESSDITGLVVRFEEPVTTNRWDFPLFKIEVKIQNENRERCGSSPGQRLSFLRLNDGKLPLNDIYRWLFEGKSLSANESTETSSIMPADFLHILDHITKEVVTNVIEQQQTASPGDTFNVPGCPSSDGKVE
uniref:Protein KTI12 homolog n=1 Tax=Setaria digitata TaxID=48799 RepID=A0A915PWH5_9BILA